MTRSSIQEYAEVMRKRYRNAGKRVKRKLLDEFTKVTELHRKSAIRLLNRRTETEGKKPRGWKKKYGVKEKKALE